MRLNDFSAEHRAAITRHIRFDDPRTIRAALRAFRVSIADAAREVGLDYSRLEKILNGRAKARPGELRELAKLFGITASDNALEKHRVKS